MDVIREITLREIPLKSEIKISKRSLIEWLCLTLGLINPKDKRRGIITIMEVLLEAHKNDERLSFPEIVERVKQKEDIDDKTIYYHLKRLKNMGLITRINGKYVFGDGSERSLGNIFSKVIEEHCEKTKEKIKEALRSYQFS